MKHFVEFGCVEFKKKIKIDENSQNYKFHGSVFQKLPYLMGIYVYNIKKHI